MYQQTTNSTQQKHKIPINRNNLFFGKVDYDFEVQMAMGYLMQDMNTSVILYQVDRQKTNVNSTYLESQEDEIRFKTPVEIPCVYEVTQSENQAYDKNKALGRYSKTGNISLFVYLKTLEEMDCDFKYGDYIGVLINNEHIEYFTVSNDGKKNFSNQETLYGYKPYYRKIEGVTIDINEFNGK